MCDIEGCAELTPIYDWASMVRDKVTDDVLKIETKQPGVCFSNTLVEINIDTTLAIDNICKEYPNNLYGVLTSDEGWRYLLQDGTKRALDNQWGVSSRSMVFAIGSNMLIVSINDLLKRDSNYCKEWFAKYQQDKGHENKYISYKTARNCIAGLNDLVLYEFLDYVYKQYVLEKAIRVADGLLSKDREDNVKDIVDLQESQNDIYIELEKYTYGAEVFKSLKSCLDTAFRINELVDKLKYRYERSVVLIQFRHSEKTNRRIDVLTLITIILTVISIAVAIIPNFLRKSTG
ncbi:MAG: hypothetical protein R3Y44_07720 [Rikenellaceae bacterium]